MNREEIIKFIEDVLSRRGFTPRQDAERVVLMMELQGILPLRKQTYELTKEWVTDHA